MGSSQYLLNVGDSETDRLDALLTTYNESSQHL